MSRPMPSPTTSCPPRPTAGLRPVLPLTLPLTLALALLSGCGGESETAESTPDSTVGVRDARVDPVPDAALGPGTSDASVVPPGDRLDGAATPPDPDADAAVEPAADAGPDRPDAREAPPEPDAGEGPPPPPPPPDVSCAAYDDLADAPLVAALHETLHDTYRPVPVEPDQGGTPNRYTTARHRLFIEVERETGPEGQEGVECLYTGTFFPLAPGEEPTHDTVNTEHVRPRATLDADHDSLMYSHEQSDLNHLYPTLPGANSTRGSFPFGEPVDVTNRDWAPALFGLDEFGQQVFAPRPERKGDVARAMFYMTARWGLDLEDREEAVLRAWDAADPVDARERARNDAVEAVQGNRNPFVDCPDLAARVDDFTTFAPLDTNENLASP